MLLSIAKLITLIFVTSGVVYFVYNICRVDTKIWNKLSAIVLGAVAVGAFMAQLYISILFMFLVSFSLAGLLMLALAEY